MKLLRRYRAPRPERVLLDYVELVEREGDAMPLLTMQSETFAAETIDLAELGQDPRVTLAAYVGAVRSGAMVPARWVVFCWSGWVAKEARYGVDPATWAAEPADVSLAEGIMAQMQHANGSSWVATKEFERVAAFGRVQWKRTNIAEPDPDSEITQMLIALVAGRTGEY